MNTIYAQNGRFLNVFSEYDYENIIKIPYIKHPKNARVSFLANYKTQRRK